MNEQFFSSILTDHFGTSIAINAIKSVAGGCINNTSQLVTNQGSFFIKVNDKSLLDLFEKECLGLNFLR